MIRYDCKFVTLRLENVHFQSRLNISRAKQMFRGQNTQPSLENWAQSNQTFDVSTVILSCLHTFLKSFNLWACTSGTWTTFCIVQLFEIIDDCEKLKNHLITSLPIGRNHHLSRIIAQCTFAEYLILHILFCMWITD